MRKGSHARPHGLPKVFVYKDAGRVLAAFEVDLNLHTLRLLQTGRCQVLSPVPFHFVLSGTCRVLARAVYMHAYDRVFGHSPVPRILSIHRIHMFCVYTEYTCSVYTPNAHGSVYTPNKHVLSIHRINMVLANPRILIS